MVYVNAVLNQHFRPMQLPVAVRSALGRPLRRAAALTQLALLGALAGLPEDRRDLPAALLWQSTSAPRLKTPRLLGEVCPATAEPMPYDFLATQSAIAAAQIQPFLPGLKSAMHLPLDSEGEANWSLLLALALAWLNEERFAQVLCAQLDHWADSVSGHWLVLSGTPLENSAARLQLSGTVSPATLPDTPDFPVRLCQWLKNGSGMTLSLESSAGPRRVLEFARL